MNASFAPTSCNQPTLPFSSCPGLFEKETPFVDRRVARVSKAGLQFIPSVVSDAGLGQFVYLQGHSGRRYVFSSVSADQAVLYEDALFAVAVGDSVRITSKALKAAPCAGRLYVHLPEEGSVEDTIADLNAPQ